MNIVFGIIVGLLVLMFLVVAHEFGHFIMARRNGVTVKEFGICFPPRAVAWVRKTVEITDKKTGEKVKKRKWVKIPRSEWDKPQDSLILSLNWLPIGGFCSMDGESDADTKKGTFGAASFLAKTKILFGGVVMNWLVAFVILTVLAFTGMPQFLENQFSIKADEHVSQEEGVLIVQVMSDSPAEKAGLKAGDLIIDAWESGDDSGRGMATPAQIINFGNERRGEKVKYRIVRDGEEEVLEVELNPEGSSYALGAQLGYSQSLIRYSWAAPIVGAGTMVQLTGETFKGLGQLVWNLGSGVVRQFSPDDSTREEGKEAIGAAGDSVSGPVGIIGVLFPAFVSAGITNLAFLAALISVSLACMNVIPIPALDGGRWLLIAIYRMRGKKLTKEVEEKIVSRAFTVLLILIVLITVLDIIKLF